MHKKIANVTKTTHCVKITDNLMKGGGWILLGPKNN